MVLMIENLTLCSWTLYPLPYYELLGDHFYDRCVFGCSMEHLRKPFQYTPFWLLPCFYIPSSVHRHNLGSLFNISYHFRAEQRFSNNLNWSSDSLYHVLVYTETVDRFEGARWLARQTPNILCYLTPSNSRENGVLVCIRDKLRNHPN